MCRILNSVGDCPIRFQPNFVIFVEFATESIFNQSVNHFILQTKASRKSEAIKHSRIQPESMTPCCNIGRGNTTVLKI